MSGGEMKLPHRRQFLHLAAGAAALPAVSRFAWAQAYPTRPVRIIVGFAAGGPAETDSEDHAADEWRYACMSRPYVRAIEKPLQKIVSGYRPWRGAEQPGDWKTY